LMMAGVLIVISSVEVRLKADATESGSQAGDASVYVAYYWRAKPGQIDAYNDYIRTVAVPIDEDARRAGAFDEVHTVTPAPGVTADWTHLRMFRLKSMDAARGLGAALDAATARVVNDEAKRKANSERAATLRDFVRQEIWSELR
jgi:hypothetical protein